MNEHQHQSINRFWVTGVNYRKSDTHFRSNFAIDDDQYKAILDHADEHHISEVFVLSTCNRTEIYGFADHPEQLSLLLCSETRGTASEFTRDAYIRQGNDAILHLFNVAGGLDSQILGDYEIVGQLKKAVHIAHESHKIGQFTDRLFKAALNASRAIRSETRLSSGTVSVAFAAVQYLKNNIKDIYNKNILVIGTGTIGQAVCRDIAAHLSPERLCISNRTFSKAIALGNELHAKVYAYPDLHKATAQADVIIVSTAAAAPLLTAGHHDQLMGKVLIDMSIPHNIDPDLHQYKDLTLIDVDELSKINDETLRMRQAEVPKAHALITYHIHQFAEWYMMLQNVPVIKEAKEKLTMFNEELQEAHNKHTNGPEAVQKALNEMALKLRKRDGRPGCNFIEAFSSFLDYQNKKLEPEMLVINAPAGKCPYHPEL